MAHPIIVGSLASQNWHRQARKLPAPERFDFVYGKTVAMARRFGFRPMGLDFALNYLPSTDDHYLDELKARFAADGVIPAVGFTTLPLSYDDELRREAIDQARRGLEQVVRLGAERGFFGAQPNGRVTRPGHLRLCVEMLRDVGRAAADAGVRITQENFNYFTSNELAWICREVDLPGVGVHSDTGNWLILGEDPLQATRRVLPYTLHAHVRDYVLVDDTYNGCAVGDGLVDFARVLPELARAAERHPLVFSMEVDTDTLDEDLCAERSYAYLKSWLVQNGYHTA